MDNSLGGHFIMQQNYSKGFQVINGEESKWYGPLPESVNDVTDNFLSYGEWDETGSTGHPSSHPEDDGPEDAWDDGEAMPEDDDDDSAPCFARESTYACRVSDSTASPAAFDRSCFGVGGIEANRVLMGSLRAGDIVLDSKNSVSRVIVNQHVVDGAMSRLLSLRFNAGTALTVTPDHALFADGEFKSAVNVKPGTLL